MRERARRSPSGSGCPRSSGGCWRSAASISTTRRAFSRRACATSCPIRRICATWTRPSARLVRAVRDGETIGVFGDYDVDGATSAALLTRFFAAIGTAHPDLCAGPAARGLWPQHPGSAAPARRGRAGRRDGRLRHDGASAAGRSRRGRARRDRHRSSRRRAAAAARRSRSSTRTGSTRPARTARWRRSASPFCWSSRSTARCAEAGWYSGGRAEPDLLQWLDLVALGTVCDVVPLAGVNRALVAQGIKVAAAPRQSRARGAGRRRPASTSRIDAYHLGFVLGPRVNAGGRVGAADLGARLLATDDPALAAELAGAPRRLQPRAPRDRGAHLGGGDRDGRRIGRNRRSWSSPRPRIGIPG